MTYLAVLSIVWTVVGYVATFFYVISSVTNYMENRDARARRFFLMALAVGTVTAVLNTYAATHTQHLP